MHDPQHTPPTAPTPSPATWAVLAHLGGIVAYFFIGWVTPLVIWLLHRRTQPALAEEARSALNFQLTVLVALVAARIVEEFPFIGFVGTIARVGLGIAALVLAVLAAAAVNNGGRYRYPLSLDLVR